MEPVLEITSKSVARLSDAPVIAENSPDRSDLSTFA